MSIILCVCCACAELAVIPENVPKPASARKTPARTTNSPIKTRRLKKADCDADFFFINDYDQWLRYGWNLSVKRRLWLKCQKRVNTFFISSVWSSPDLIESDRGTDDKLFFIFFYTKVERVVLNALVKRMRLCRLNFISSNAARAMRRRSCAFGGWFWHRPRKRSGPIHLNVHVRMDRSSTASIPLSRTNRQPPDSPECNSSLLSALRRAHRLAAGGQNILPARRPDWFAYENVSNL
jgi:hypothetical protein